MATEKPHRVAIVGCGFAGLFATYALRRAPVTVTIIAGPEEKLGALRNVRATFVVDSLAEYDAHLRSTGAMTLQGPSATPAGTNMIVRDVEGVVFEFVEPHSKE